MPFCYDQPKANGDIISVANRFEEDLDRHVNPWLAYIGGQLRENLAITAILVLIGLGLIIIQAWWPDVVNLQLAAIGIALSLLVTLIQIFRRDMARTDGHGVQQSQGLALTGSELGSVLKEIRKELEAEQEQGKTGLDARNSECAMESAVKLCGLRMKALFLHQKVLRRKGIFIEESGRAFSSAIQTARLLPLIILPAAGTFAAGFAVADGWGSLRTHAGFLATPASAVAGLSMVTAYIPFLTAVRFGRRIERQLFDVLESNWQLDPTGYDSTGPIITQYEKLLQELTNLRSMLTWQQGQNGRWNDGAKPPSGSSDEEGKPH